MTTDKYTRFLAKIEELLADNSLEEQLESILQLAKKRAISVYEVEILLTVWNNRRQYKDTPKEGVFELDKNRAKGSTSNNYSEAISDAHKPTKTEPIAVPITKTLPINSRMLSLLGGVLTVLVIALVAKWRLSPIQTVENRTQQIKQTVRQLNNKELQGVKLLGAKIQDKEKKLQLEDRLISLEAGLRGLTRAKNPSREIRSSIQSYKTTRINPCATDVGLWVYEQDEVTDYPDVSDLSRLDLYQKEVSIIEADIRTDEERYYCVKGLVVMIK